MVGYGMKEMDAIRAATVMTADLFGIAGDTGTLETGIVAYCLVVVSLFVVSKASAQPSNSPEETTTRYALVHAGALLAVPGQPPESEKTLVIKNDRIESMVVFSVCLVLVEAAFSSASMVSACSLQISEIGPVLTLDSDLACVLSSVKQV